MILPTALCFALHQWHQVARDFRHGSYGRLLKLGHPAAMKTFLLIAAATTIFLAVIFSFSRMGMIAMLASLAIVAVASCLGKRRRPKSIFFVAATVLLGSVLTAWLGAGPILEHFEQLKQNESFSQNTAGRFALAKDTLALIRTHPWSGIGLGCFQYAFTKFQTIRLTYIADHAHNDYLELMSELGIPAAVTLFALIFYLVGRTFYASLHNSSSLSRSLALGSCCGTFAILVHGIADFNLYIPANGLVFAVLLGMGYRLCSDGKGNGSIGRHESREAFAPSQVGSLSR